MSPTALVPLNCARRCGALLAAAAVLALPALPVAASTGIFGDRTSFLVATTSASFFGVWSGVAFDPMQIRETVGTDDNEFYGHFYTGFTAPVPEPASWALLVLGLLAGRGMQRRDSGTRVRTPGRPGAGQAQRLRAMALP